MARLTSILRSERVAAALLLLAAASGLLVANLPGGPAVVAWTETRLAVPGLELSLAHWASDGLLAVFFFIAAVELKREFAVGGLSSPAAAALPAIAAAGGVLAPALLFLAFTAGGDSAVGWPIPTATDIAFALGVLAVFGRYLPTRVRVFLLALAVLDDLAAILLIAVFFTERLDLVALGASAVAVAAFGAASRLPLPSGGRGRPTAVARVAVLVVLAVVAWAFLARSGVHPTIAGVALGFALPRRAGGRASHALEPWSNGLVLPLFAFTAALVPVPRIEPASLDPAFWGILVGLPLGKLVGITVAATIAAALLRPRGAGAPARSRRLSFGDFATVGAVGGVGFTVSLLMNELAFAEHPLVADEGTLAVLGGSAIAIVLSAVVVSARSAHYRRLGAAPGEGGGLAH